jgi:addiction module HigA family antidote
LILSFGDKETREFYRTGESKRLPSELWGTALRKLEVLDKVEALEDIKALPKSQLKALGDDFVGYYSIRVDDQWKITFKLEGTDASEVIIEKFPMVTREIHPSISIFERVIPPIHPGEVLSREFLEPLKWSQSEFAETLGVNFRTIHDIVNGKRGISPEMAIRLAEHFGTTAQFWMNFQRDLKLWKAYKKLKEKGSTDEGKK